MGTIQVRVRQMLSIFMVLILAGHLPGQEPSPKQQEAAGKESLEELFQQALRAEGMEYLKIRRRILARPEEAVPFLKQQQNSADRHVRILANALLTWIQEPEKNKNRELFIYVEISFLRRFRGEMWKNVDMAPVKSVERPSSETLGVARPPHRPLPPEFQPNDPGAAAFLLELVLKGAMNPPQEEDVRKYLHQKYLHFPKEEKERMQRVIESWAIRTKRIREDPQAFQRESIWTRWYAICFVGVFDEACSDVLPVLVELLQTSKDPILRDCAVGGLARTESLSAIEPLIQALEDEDYEVRKGAFRVLNRLTGDPFGFGKKYFFQPPGKDEDWKQFHAKYQAWWKENKEQVLKKK